MSFNYSHNDRVPKQIFFISSDYLVLCEAEHPNSPINFPEMN